MKSVVTIRLLLATIVVTTTLACTKRATPMDEAITPASSFYLTDQEVVDLHDRAERGDIEAMNKLANYYSMTGNDEVGMGWIMKAAEAGDKKAQYFIVSTYSASNRLEDRQLAESLRKKWGVQISRP